MNNSQTCPICPVCPTELATSTPTTPSITPGKRRNKVIKAGLIILFIFIIMITVGLIGYRYFFGMSPKDALAKSSVSASDLGLNDESRTTNQKIFLAAYSLICSVFFISLASAIVSYVFTLYFEGWIG